MFAPILGKVYVYTKLEKVVFFPMHLNLRQPDVASVVLGFNYEA